MSKIAINTFTAYEQSEKEQLSGMSLNTEQQQFLQTNVSRIAEELIALKPDPTSYAIFIQEEAYLKGQLDFAKYLLDCSAQAAQQILAAIAEDSQ